MKMVKILFVGVSPAFKIGFAPIPMEKIGIERRKEK